MVVGRDRRLSRVPEASWEESMNSNTRNIVIVVIIILLAILAYYMWAGSGTAPTPATTTTPADTTQPATNNNTQTQ